MTDAIVFILWGAVEVLFVLTGKLVVSAISLGHWRGEALSGNEHRMHGPAGALSFRRDGQRVVTCNGLLLVGVLFYVVLALALSTFAPFLR